MHHVDFHPLTRLVLERGGIGRIGGLARELGCARALIVTDVGIVAAGHVQHALDSLAAAGLKAFVFDGVGENPTTEHVAQAAAAARASDIDLFIGLGGGSSMDCAKGANFILTNGGSMRDYWGRDKASKPMLPLIAIPTTAGTGSETQSYALISDAETHVKMACGDAKAAARIALLDPELTLSQPRMVAAITGMDAMSHAIESFVSKSANPISRMFSREAWRLLSGNYAAIFARPDDVEARGAMLLGASLAGLAIENSMLGATHAAANPLTAHFSVTHGIAIGVMLPHVIRLNEKISGDIYRDLIADLPEPREDEGRPAGEQVARFIERARATAGLPENLSDCGVARGALLTLGEEAAQQWTNQHNPRSLTPEQFTELYAAAFGA